VSALATSGDPTELARLAGRLAERRPEIERAILARVYGVSDPASVGDPQYVAGLRSAVSAALSVGIEAISVPRERTVSIPLVLLDQAREAARREIGLDVVLRRYLAGYTLLCDFIAEEAEQEAPFLFKRIQRRQAALFDRLLIKVADAYKHEAQRCPRNEAQRRAQLVQMLLAGELIETAELGYELEAWHLAAIASGPGCEETLRALAACLDRRLLLVGADEDAAWAWLGGRRAIPVTEVAELAASTLPPEVFLAFGEVGEGLEGWRTSHRQAKAAFSVAQRRDSRIASHGEVALLASVLGDELLSSSLKDAYLAPLARERDGGAALRETLRAYFAAKGNVTSAAAALGVARQTVTLRLRSAEEKIGKPVESCAVELDIALRLNELTDSPVPPR